MESWKFPMLAAELLITFVIKNIQMYVGICEMLTVCNFICIWVGKNTESWKLWNLIQDIKQTSDPSVWMPAGAWSMTFSSGQWLATLRPGVKLDGQFHISFHTSLPLSLIKPWKAPMPESHSTFLLWPQICFVWKWLCSFPLSEIPLLEEGWSQVKIVVEYSPGWSLPLLWLWTNFSRPQSEQVHWLITKNVS